MAYNRSSERGKRHRKDEGGIPAEPLVWLKRGRGKIGPVGSGSTTLGIERSGIPTSGVLRAGGNKRYRVGAVVPIHHGLWR